MITGPLSREWPWFSRVSPISAMSKAFYASCILCILTLTAPAPQDIADATFTPKHGWITAESTALSPSQITGKWAKAYDPSLRGAYEIDAGYLVIHTDGTFGDYYDSSTLKGRWQIRGNTVVLTNVRLFDERSGAGGRKPDFSWTQRILEYSPSRRVVLFNALKSPVKADVLMLNGELNYSYAKTR